MSGGKWARGSPKEDGEGGNTTDLHVVEPGWMVVTRTDISWAPFEMSITRLSNLPFFNHRVVHFSLASLPSAGHGRLYGVELLLALAWDNGLKPPSVRG